MEKKSKGRPPKPYPKRKRLQYSVWVSAEEKQQIDKMIEASNLSASQFFLTQIIEKPIQRPKKKTLPKSVMNQLCTLEKLAGLLALSVLKTKDKDMAQATNWQQSSQHIKWISELIALYIFEDFDFPKLTKTLQQIRLTSEQLYKLTHVSEMDEFSVLAKRLFHYSNDLLLSFVKHYQEATPTQLLSFVWEDSFEIHHYIAHLKNEILR